MPLLNFGENDVHAHMPKLLPTTQTAIKNPVMIQSNMKRTLFTNIK